MKLKLSGIAFAIINILFFNACSMNEPRPPYVTSTINTGAAKVVMSQTNNATVDIESFSTLGNMENITCRKIVYMGTPAEYTSYVENALKTEFAMAGMLSSDSPIKIKGIVKKVEGANSVYRAYWAFDIELISSNGKSMTVSSKYDYSPVWNGTESCVKMKNTFIPATQKLIREILSNPEFVQLIK